MSSNAEHQQAHQTELRHVAENTQVSANKTCQAVASSIDNDPAMFANPYAGITTQQQCVIAWHQHTDGVLHK